MDLAKFVNDRLNEDEAAAKGYLDALAVLNPPAPEQLAGLSGESLLVFAMGNLAERMLREADVKRQIIAEHRQGDDGSVWCHTCDPAADMDDSERWYPCRTVRLLAAVWSDHPDYDPAWKD